MEEADVGSSGKPEKPSFSSFESLMVWQDAHSFVLEVYRSTSMLPDSQKYGLASQFQRAAVSIAANIAEGYRRPTNPDKRRFYGIADASIDECRYYCILCRDLGFAVPDNWEERLARVQGRLVNYMNKLRAEKKPSR